MKLRELAWVFSLSLLFGIPALAQQPRIAFVDPGVRSTEMGSGHVYWGVLLEELAKLGYVEGKTATVERWGAGGDSAGYAALARKVAGSAPQVIVVRGRSMLVHIAAASKSAPIVAIGTIPPDLRVSIARPGKNVTGIMPGGYEGQTYGKELEFLRDLLKPNARVAWFGPRFLWDTVTGQAQRKGALALKMDLQPAFVEAPVTEESILQGFDKLARGKFDAVLVSPATEFFPHIRMIAALLASKRLPSVGNSGKWAEAGMTLGYGADYPALYRQLARYVDKILKGEKPGDIPIEQPAKFELVVNMKTAKRIGITIPPSVHMRADRMIE